VHQFVFSKGEIRGIIVLSALTISIAIAPSFLQKEKQEVSKVKIQYLDSLLVQETKKADNWSSNKYAKSFKKKSSYKKYAPAPRKKAAPVFSVEKININKADKQSLVRLKGIGNVYAQRIIKYRNLLGGFYSVDQLSEIYGLPDSTLLSIDESLFVSDFQPTKLDLKTASYKELLRHPYIDGREEVELVLEFQKGQLEWKYLKLGLSKLEKLKYYITY